MWHKKMDASCGMSDVCPRHVHVPYVSNTATTPILKYQCFIIVVFALILTNILLQFRLLIMNKLFVVVIIEHGKSHYAILLPFT